MVGNAGVASCRGEATQIYIPRSPPVPVAASRSNTAIEHSCIPPLSFPLGTFQSIGVGDYYRPPLPSPRPGIKLLAALQGRIPYSCTTSNPQRPPKPVAREGYPQNPHHLPLPNPFCAGARWILSQTCAEKMSCACCKKGTPRLITHPQAPPGAAQSTHLPPAVSALGQRVWSSSTRHLRGGRRRPQGTASSAEA